MFPQHFEYLLCPNLVSFHLCNNSNDGENGPLASRLRTTWGCAPVVSLWHTPARKSRVAIQQYYNPAWVSYRVSARVPTFPFDYSVKKGVFSKGEFRFWFNSPLGNNMAAQRRLEAETAVETLGETGPAGNSNGYKLPPRSRTGSATRPSAKSSRDFAVREGSYFSPKSFTPSDTRYN